MPASPSSFSSAYFDHRYAVVYFDLQIDIDGIEETAYDEDSPDHEYANELLSVDQALLRLEQDAYNEVKKKFKALGFIVSDDGRAGIQDLLVCKFSVSSWVDVDRLNRWIRGHMGGGDDIVYLNTPYASVQGFTFYPTGVNNEKFGPPESSLDEWLAATKPLAIELTYPALSAELPGNVLAIWPDGVHLQRSAGSAKFLDGGWEAEEEIRFDLFIGADKEHVLSLFLAPMIDSFSQKHFLGPAELQFVSREKRWTVDAGRITRDDMICKLTWFLMSTLPEHALRLEATASLLEDLRIPRFLPDSVEQMTEDIESEALAFHNDLSAIPTERAQRFVSKIASMLGGKAHPYEPKYGFRYGLEFSLNGNRYSMICEKMSYDADLNEFDPSWSVHAGFFLEKKNSRATFCIVDENDVVIGAGRTPREALSDVPFFVWPRSYEDWALRRLQPGDLLYKEEIEVMLILDELPMFYRSDTEFSQWYDATRSA